MTGLSYPPAARLDLTETLHGQAVSDPYRWLEDPGDPQAQDWLRAQDELYASYLAGLRGRDRFASRLTELLAAGAVGTPAWRGASQFYTRREAGQEHAVLYTATASRDDQDGQGVSCDPDTRAPASNRVDESGDGSDAGGRAPASNRAGERALIDPMAVDPTGGTTLDSWQPDHEGRLLAYQLSEGGREESVLRVMDVVTGVDVDGPIDRCRYTAVAWLPGGERFYYSRRLAPDSVPAGESQYHRRVYLHKLGTPASDDTLILGDGLDKTNHYGVSVSRDGRWFVITASAGTAPRDDVWVADLSRTDPAAPELLVVQQGVDARTWPVPGRDGRLYLLTDSGAPRRKIAVADPAHPAFPAQQSWQELLAEDSEAVLTDFAVLDGPELDRPLLLAARCRHAISELTVHDLASGAQLGKVELPGLGTIGGLSERPEGGHEAWFGYTDYATPGLVLRYDATAGNAQVWQRAPGNVAIPPVLAEQVTFTSADGTTVRMVVVSAPDRSRARSAGNEANSTQDDIDLRAAGGEVGVASSPARPAILYGYGGFNVSMTPAFSASILAWVEAGGIYAIAGLRGGSEEGEEWHRSGMRAHKQNVFDDFHAAAEQLIADGRTTSEQLTVWGGSNGGLLVGAAITQRPELAAAAVCSAPLLDMVRYELFGLGESWNDEYGTAADPEQLGWLLGYSPYHHVQAGARYPAVVFTVFDGDTRVDPLHARKMCAALQYATAAPADLRPVLLRREGDVGHGARAVSRSIGLSAETLAFAATQTGLPVG
ncbi:MAG: prolyl oligopeptidase family serine peptidase [Streptosporangiaceae bacterium]